MQKISSLRYKKNHQEEPPFQFENEKYLNLYINDINVML